MISRDMVTHMVTHKLAVIGGDGIGPEVTTEAVKVMRAAGVALDITQFDLGGGRYLRDGEILSDSTLQQLRKLILRFDAFGNDSQVQALGHRDHCLDECRVV